MTALHVTPFRKVIYSESLSDTFKFIGDDHVFALKQSLALYDFYQAQVDECDSEIEQALVVLKADKPEDPLPKARYRTKQPNAVNFAVRASLYQMFGVDLTQIHGIGPFLALRLIAGCGTANIVMREGITKCNFGAENLSYQSSIQYER